VNSPPKDTFPQTSTPIFSLNIRVNISHNVLGVHEDPAYEISGTRSGSVHNSPGILLLSSNLCVEDGPGSVVGIATGYGMDGPGVESRLEARFSAPVQTGPGTHPASCTMDTGSFTGVKSDRGVTLTPHPLLVPWS
jgi:hypothetical protein